MQRLGEHLVTGVLGKALETIGLVDTETPPFLRDLQAAEMRFQPDPGRASRDARRRLGVLGRIARSPCLIESFHRTPALVQVRDVLSRQLNLDRARRPPGRSPDQISNRTPLPLWLLSTGRPRTLLGSPAMKPMASWPCGFWRAEIPVEGLRIIVLAELPDNRDTLLLRLLGRGPTFTKAVRQLLTLSRHDWTWRIASPSLVTLRMELAQQPNPQLSLLGARELSQVLRQLDQVYDRWERETLQRGALSGRTEAFREALETLLVARFGRVPRQWQTQVQSADAETLAGWVARVPSADSMNAVFVARDSAALKHPR